MISKRRFSLPRLDITGMWVFSLGVWFHIVARLVYSKPWMAFFLAELIAAILVLFGAYQVLDAWIARVSREEREALEARQQAMMTDYIGYDILLQYIQELIQQARAMVATGNYDEAVIEHINDNMNDATRQIAAFQSQVQVQQDALLVVDRQMSYMRQQLSARMLSRYQNNYHFGGSTL